MKIKNFCHSRILFCLISVLLLMNHSTAQDFKLRLRSQIKSKESKNFQHELKNETWKPEETAIIVCDFWDYHHCLNAVRRMKEFGPRLNEVIKTARGRGATIIHSPSDCMESYEKHPARLRALQVDSFNPPKDITSWCSKLPEEEKAVYPIDQSDGGEDDEPGEHAQWAKRLKALGRNPALPWKKQNAMIEIDQKSDYLSDKGDEVWNILKSKKIKNVILVGVHTNMCVLGRPFGLRQLKRNGMHAVLMRDMTDTMYNPKRWPFVSHHAGTDLIISHIEKYVCPTITSDQILGGKSFVFQNDDRPELAVVVGEKEYKTHQSLPNFVETHLRDFRCRFVYANPENRNDFPELETIKDSDLLLLSVRRRVLKPEQMKIFKDFEAAGKPIIGIRTASHAFSLRNQEPPEGHLAWPEFDAEVFGGNYTNHYGNDLASKVTYTDKATSHPITKSLALDRVEQLENQETRLKSFRQGGSLYRTSPLKKGTSVLLVGTVFSKPGEPAAWTFRRANGGKSFYTSLGHPDDFENKEFVRLLSNVIRWAAGKEITVSARLDKKPDWQASLHAQLPADTRGLHVAFESADELAGEHTKILFRKAVKIPATWRQRNIVVEVDSNNASCWINGQEVSGKSSKDKLFFSVPQNSIDFGEANWLAIGIKHFFEDGKNKTWKVTISDGKDRHPLNGWEWVSLAGDLASVAKTSLPAKFGSATHVYSEIK